MLGRARGEEAQERQITEKDIKNQLQDLFVKTEEKEYRLRLVIWKDTVQVVEIEDEQDDERSLFSRLRIRDHMDTVTFLIIVNSGSPELVPLIDVEAFNRLKI